MDDSEVALVLAKLRDRIGRRPILSAILCVAAGLFVGWLIG